MRRKLWTAAVAVVVTVAGAPAATADVPGGILSSPNVSIVGTIPLKGAIGGRVREIQGRRAFVTTAVGGVSVFDITNPELPVLWGHLPLPHWENEDVDTGGDLVIVSQDPDFTGSALGGVYILDISRLPLITFAYTNPLTGNRLQFPAPMGSAGHTATCVRSDCSWLWVNGDKDIAMVDLTNPAQPNVVGSVVFPLGTTHDAQVDEAGVVWVVGGPGTGASRPGGFVAYDTTGAFVAGSGPGNPSEIIAHSAGAELNYHHNSWRPRAAEWTPRNGHPSPGLRPGELLLVTEEDVRTNCGANEGRFATATVADFDTADGGDLDDLGVIDSWTTELGLLPDGWQTAAAQCSAHYFTERDGIVAIGWYSQGTRFLDVSDPADIRQVGWFLSTDATTWASYWITDEIVYSVDVSRGIDILRFDRDAPMPTTTAPILPQWLAGDPGARPHPTWGYACRIPVAG